MNTSTNSLFTALALKIAGIIFIISSLLDYFVLAYPFKPLDPRWQISFTTDIVDRGIVPMVGMCLLLIGYWIEGSRGAGVAAPRESGSIIKLPVFILASLLGLMFLLLVPLHLNNMRIVSADTLEQIDKGATQAQQRLTAEINNLKESLKDPKRVEQLDLRIQQINQIINSGQVNGQQLSQEQLQEAQNTKNALENLRKLRGNPKAEEEFINQLQNRLASQKLERETLARKEAFKQGFRTGMSSLLLAGGYMAIGWLGLKGIGSNPLSSKKSAKR
jgi:hypothetical protein